ncbi:MAG: hypothetical protein ACO3DS_03565, partial [Phycisphaerales bacterium]
QLTPAVVNAETGLFLHRFQWLTDDVIGSLPVTWNYLEGWHTKDDCEDPIAVHYTRGGPWFDNWRHVEYGNEWSAAAERYRQTINLDNEHTLFAHTNGSVASPKTSHA